MKNPLHKRLPREIRSEFGKYIVIFLLMVATIGFVSGSWWQTTVCCLLIRMDSRNTI